MCTRYVLEFEYTTINTIVDIQQALRCFGLNCFVYQRYKKQERMYEYGRYKRKIKKYKNKGNSMPRTKEEYITKELDTVCNSPKLTFQILEEYFWNNIKDLSDEDFKKYLIEQGYEDDK